MDILEIAIYFLGLGFTAEELGIETIVCDFK